MSQLTSQLPPDLIAHLANRHHTQRYGVGDVLIEEGLRENALYVLLSGRLCAFTTGARGRELIYSIVEPGEFFGEMFLDGEPRSASVKAMAASECLVIPGDAVRDLIRTHPEFAECLIASLISRLRHATGKFKTTALDDVFARTVVLLEEVAVPDGELWSIPKSLTQTEIASRIGATREMVNHIIRDLIRNGFIFKVGNRQLMILKKLPKRW